jgi:predicted choloylglycine hydrolase
MRILSFTWPGTVWCNAGLNRHGIAQAGASVGTETVDGRGLESNLLQRVILEHSTDLGEAVDIAMSYPAKNHACNITLSDGESLVVVEKGVGEAALRFPRDGVIFATNHWVSRRMREVCYMASPEFERNTQARWANLARLAAQATECHTVERMMAILRDHTDPGAICQHGPLMHTSVAYVLVPRLRQAYFAFGRPCQAQFVRFSLH